ncbi:MULTISPECIES: ABC transporter substrate-binding protein [Streptomyces]|uniref:Iron ABC transporter substrate-binding protein n=1 Tax=Streptomyces tsukubensis (strain DSM 42081 / NBRC 108919 / NRRL 18488 / 9993) TaxID=1114943 RepID=I2N8Y1_STRT9|nr:MULTISPECIES: ABC transporter substrate-binding protein [Streptomyces]AZK97340.1 iron ABC transporter substrate-binding protein [Streptomyces tsukubensis]EIF93478.1 siderophore-binding lipoprotein (transporter associated) [Streptomyces tsukubensis NRRL18488]MYS67235.1 ABC transporter substrate-binding protein [Streptomyces sp. SID5473]QKM66701.1 iron ABC transporter substrate-binding protein [Streptomyces tsukubensis NRRL18488]TAI44952.1 iron-siderophore ABC transporter substrate-binding pr
MARSPRTARITAAVSSALLLLTAATACGTDSGGSGSSGGTTEKNTGAEGGGSGTFPVTLDHKYGSTTVPSEPKRIVTIGFTDQDALLAVGKVPVASTDWLGAHKGTIGPWAKDELGSGKLPVTLKNTGTGPQVEKIAALKPDLILAVYGGLTKDQYTALSKFAPVVAQPKKYNDWGVPWQEQTKIVGTAVGRPAEAAQAVAATEKKIASLVKPEFKGKTAVIGTPFEGIFVWGSQDTRSRLLTGLGFRLPAGLDKVIGDQFGANISKERTDLLDHDAMVWMVKDVAKDSAELRKDPSYGDLKVVGEGREIYVQESSDYGYAMSFGTVLSLPYVVERLAPQLTAALDGKPETPVRQPAS